MYRTKQEFLEKLEKELARFGVVDKSEIIADFEQHFTDSLALGTGEAEICEKLGDISEIAKQYAEAEIFPVVAVEPEKITTQAIVSDAKSETEFSTESTPEPTPYEKSGIKLNFGGNSNGGTPPPHTNQNADSHHWNGGNGLGGGTPYENSGIRLDNGGIKVGGLITVILVDIFVLSWALPVLFSLIIALLSIPVALIGSGIGIIAGGAFNLSGFFSPFSTISTIFAGAALLAAGGLLVLAGIALIKLFVKLIRAVINWHGKMVVGRPVFEDKKKRERAV
ncbi:MAG: DUF1700 domain-containing protein [Oscillospiraceae bacterium]|nr:DUF1700 domain-containing protein [Oscillospiraceae bacterium]